MRVLEASDKESISAFALKLGASGSVLTNILRAYEQEETSKVTDRLGLQAAT